MARFCNQCGASIPDDAAFCVNCGSPVNQVSADPAAEGQSPVDTATQPTAQMPAQQATSQSFGQAPTIQTPVIQAPTANNNPLQSGNKKQSLLIIGIVVAVVIIIAAILIGVFVVGGQDSEQNSEPVNTPVAQVDKSSTVMITFNTNGGSAIDQLAVGAGEAITFPADPTRAGYKFDGWYTDPGLTMPVSRPLEIDSDITLYAKWTSDKDTVDAPLTVVGRDGATRNATIHRDGTTGRVFPRSNVEALTDAQIAALSDAERCVAWNEIIASAVGYEFKNSGLKTYFNDYCSWYKPSGGVDNTNNLSKVENENIERLKRATDSWWINLATN